MSTQHPRRGTLRVYLGAAPGVGKTFAMLNEGRRLHDRGTEVVIAAVETHGRPATAAQIGDLEVLARRAIEYRGTTFQEMDVDAVLARAPRVALVDELAHTNVPGSRNDKRWQDVQELLDAGIDVVSTLNIQHLESLNDVVERITGIVQRETIPDWVVRRAEQVELVDMTPEALRRRMAHGSVYAPEKVDAALANYFREGNLGALRELALLWVADQVDVALEDYRRRHGITQPWETRERVVVAITGAPGTESLIRRGARMAQRAHGDLLGVHVSSDEGLAITPSGLLESHKALLAELGGEYHEVVAADVAIALVDFAAGENATQLILGSSMRSRWAELLRGSVINKVVRRSGAIDIHVVNHKPSPDEQGLLAIRRRRRRVAALSSWRQAMGWAVAGSALPLLTLALANLRSHVALPSVLLLYLLVAVAAAGVGGFLPAVATAAVGFFLANWFFTQPLHRFTIAEAENVLALIVFLVVAAVVSGLVDVAARRAAEAARARAEAETLARLAGTMGQQDPLQALVASLRSTFALESVAVLRRTGEGWSTEAAAGSPAPGSPDVADTVEALSGDLVLALVGARLGAEDRRVLNAFAAQLAAAVERNRLNAAVDEATVLSQANDLRTALLQAVSHDLRTPLASIKASVSSLRQRDIAWSPEDASELHATIEEETDRLTALVTNLLDMSRLQAGVLQPALRPVGLEDVVPAALASLGRRGDRVESTLEEVLAVMADPALLERVVANLVSNALSWSPPDRPVRVEAGAVAGRVDLRVVDRGPGIAVADRERVFLPFQRLGDQGTGNGVGLGLAVARGFVDAMGGELTIDDTAGGGTSVVVSLPAAPQ